MATQLKTEASIPQILSEMSPKEKMLLLTGSTPFRGGGNEKHGIPAPLFLDGGTGFNTMQMRFEAAFQAKEETEGKVDPETLIEPMESFAVAAMAIPKYPDRIREILDETRPADRKLGCYPPGMLLGATMNPEVIRRCGEALGEEALACGVDVLLGTPNVNIHRDPRGGRIFEGYSEDPCVVSALAPAFVEGIQSIGVIADVKHFAANNSETDRMGVDEHISERALREIYLPGFEACVKAGCKTVMSAYNSINGTPCAQNPWLLRDVLRGEWGFDGFVMSDWGAVYDRIEGQLAGNDVAMPGPREIGPMMKAYEEGILTDDVLDEACANYLKILLQMPVMTGAHREGIDTEKSMRAAYQAAAEGITLLRNRKDLLPLSKQTGVAFYGNRSKQFTPCGAGSAEVDTVLATSMFDASAEKTGADRVSFEEITDATDVVIVTVGANGQEGADRPDMNMEPEDVPVMEKALADAKAAGKPVVLVLNIAGPVDLSAYEADIDAILCVYLPGMAGGQAAADILFGDVNPSGKLPLSYPRRYTDTPTYGNFPGECMKENYGEGIYVGYRYYDLKGIRPLFCFGHGQSYTTFALSDFRVQPEIHFEQAETLCAEVTIKNTGKRAGSETVMLFVSECDPAIDKPFRELKRFQKVFLEPQEQKTVRFLLTEKDFASFDMRLGQWAAKPGAFRIFAGTSAEDLPLAADLRVHCYNPYGLTVSAPVAKVLRDPAVNGIMKRLVPETDFAAAMNQTVVFMPNTPFSEAWNRSIAPLLPGTEEEKEQRFAAVREAFREANLETC